MGRKPATSCAECQRLREQLAAQQAQIDALQATIGPLQQQLVSLQERLAHVGKDSSTSSKPPSSDLVKPPKPPPPDGQAKRQPGGQPGHPHHQRLLVPAELLSGGVQAYTLELCPSCGQGLQPTDVP